MVPVVALVGRPNVGKSTLFNRLTRTRDALVADFPGLTRDRKYGRAEVEGREFICIDTGGIDGTEDGVETRMAEQSLLAIEEGGAIDGSLEALRMLYELGVRAMTLTWSNRNDIADGVNEECSGGGLTTFGRQVVAEMNRLGMLVDVSHIATAGFWDVIETSTKPIIATHSNAKTLCSHPRNLNDDQIKAINANDGLIGITFAGQFLEEDYNNACIDSVYRHIDYMLNLLGNDDHVGFGSDFDGISHPPYNIHGVQDYKPLIEYLQSKNYSDSTIEKITHKNVLNLLGKVL